MVIDAIFSLDSSDYRRVGMVDHLLVMMAAVVIAISLMLMGLQAVNLIVNNSHPDDRYSRRLIPVDDWL